MIRPLQRAAWQAHARTTRFAAAVQRAAALARQHAAYAVSVSWGKDSVALLHLAANALGRVVAVHGRYPPQDELPDVPDVRDRVLRLLGDAVVYVEAPVYGDWEIFSRAGHFFQSPRTPRERELVRAWKRDFVAAIEGAAARAGATGMMIGMRADESRGRRLNVATRGQHYTASGRLPTLLPLARWSADDVCAYHVAHGLPWLRIYDCGDDPRRARSEMTFVAGAGDDALRRHGAWEAWREAYPDLWRQWQKRWLAG